MYKSKSLFHPKNKERKMKTATNTYRCHISWGIALFLAALLLVSCTPTPSPTPTSTPIPSLTSTLAPTSTPIPSPTSTPVPSPTEPVADLQFDFSYPNSTASEFKIGEFITAEGTHNLSQESFAWTFLKDSFGGYYLQSPAVDFYSESNWESTNIRLGKDVINIVAVLVDSEGNSTIEYWVTSNRFGKIDKSEIEGLSGYRELGRIRITVK
jgi:hypothetical protein